MSVYYLVLSTDPNLQVDLARSLSVMAKFVEGMIVRPALRIEAPDHMRSLLISLGAFEIDPKDLTTSVVKKPDPGKASPAHSTLADRYPEALGITSDDGAQDKSEPSGISPGADYQSHDWKVVSSGKEFSDPYYLLRKKKLQVGDLLNHREHGPYIVVENAGRLLLRRVRPSKEEVESC